jgi:hypothetical protein
MTGGAGAGVVRSREVPPRGRADVAISPAATPPVTTVGGRVKRSPKRRRLAVGLAVALGLTACGGGGDDEGSVSSCTSEVIDTLALAAEQAAGVAQYNALTEEERHQLGVLPPRHLSWTSRATCASRRVPSATTTTGSGPTAGVRTSMPWA